MKYFISLLVLSAVLLGCEAKDPLFSDLINDKTKIILKGTYESNDPRPFWDGCPTEGDVLKDDTVTKTSETEFPTKFYLDISDMRLDGERFASKRKYMQVALSDKEDFFNGNGVGMDCYDPPIDTDAETLQIYFRNLMFDKAKAYNSKWEYKKAVKSIFNVDKVEGLNFALLMELASTDDSDSSKNRIFPFKVKISGGLNFNNKSNMIIEFRILIKNNIKRYEYYKTDDDSDSVYNSSYYAVSDSIKPAVLKNNNIGGNLIGSARAYYTDKVATIKGTATAGRMVVAIYDEDKIKSYVKKTRIPPFATWCADGTYRLKNVPVGQKYKLYYSTDTPSILEGKTPEGFTGETSVEIEKSAADKEIIVNL